MKTNKLDEFVGKLRAEWPEFVTVVRPFSSEDDPSIQHFIHILCVPVADLARVSRRAWEYAFEIFGHDPIPFHLTTIDPETAAEHFASTLANALAQNRCSVIAYTGRYDACKFRFTMDPATLPEMLVGQYAATSSIHASTSIGALEACFVSWIGTDSNLSSGSRIEALPKTATEVTQQMTIASIPNVRCSLAA